MLSYTRTWGLVRRTTPSYGAASWLPGHTEAFRVVAHGTQVFRSLLMFARTTDCSMVLGSSVRRKCSLPAQSVWPQPCLCSSPHPLCVRPWSSTPGRSPRPVPFGRGCRSIMYIYKDRAIPVLPPCCYRSVFASGSFSLSLMLQSCNHSHSIS